MIVILRDVQGERISDLELSGSRTLPSFPHGEYPMLGHVDAYGETIFNRYQMMTLIEEITRAKEKIQLTAEQRDSLDQIADMCRQGLRPPHRKLCFLGD